ncbi:MAG: endonuclease domain-containing protein [Bacteroidetes bacterium]|nr:endonuclease domain-containing protein [Bacteroidota bacterium]
MGTYTHSLLSTARSFRKNPTHTEKLMWHALRRHGQRGLKFRRQHPIIGFIVDFYCAEHRLIVEIDGDVHERSDVERRDATRQRALEQAGFRLIRFTTNQVSMNIDGVISSILVACGLEELPQTHLESPTYITPP